MRLRAASVIVLGITVIAGAARAEPPVRHEGKTLAEWIAQTARSDEKGLDAIRALERARFLVDAPAVVVPVLVRLAKRERGLTLYAALAALAAYGPLAHDALDVLAPASGGRDVSRATTRVRIGDGIEEGLRTWKEDADQQLAKADEVTRGMKLPKVVEYGDTPLFYAMTGVDLALYGGGALGLRGVGVADFAATVLRRPYGFLVAGTVLSAAEGLRIGAAPLADALVPFLDDPEPVHRGRAAHALASIPGLPPASVARMLEAALKVTHLPTLRSIAQRLAVTPHEPFDAVVAALRTLAGHADRAVAAWASAGLARRGIDPEKVLVGLLADLKRPEPDARVAAADGLLSIGRWSDETRAEVRVGLADPDRRVRWRCGAILATSEPDAAAALEALALGLDGPDDTERVAALAAVQGLGSVARPLRERVAPWSQLPLPLIARPAQQALDAIDAP